MANNAELQTAQLQGMAFQSEWLELQVVSQRFMVKTAQSPSVRLRDLAIRIFGVELPHTPVKALGINRQVQFLVRDYRERDRIGRQLAPTKPWGNWGKELDPDGSRGGMTSLTMTQVNIPERPPTDMINVTVQPWRHSDRDDRGVSVQVNDHYTVSDPNSLTATRDIIGILEDRFERSLGHSEQIINHVMSLKDV